MLLVTTRTGWIGIDVGSATVKVAQLRLCDDGWKWHAAAIVPRRDLWPDAVTAETDVLSSRDELSAVRSLLPMVRGRSAAALLPMTVCDVHAINLAVDEGAKSAALVRRWVEVATQEAADALEIRSWPMSQASNSAGGDWTGAVTLLRPWGDRLAEDVARTGWSCKAIDALPLAMARAATMVCGDDSDAPVAILDWGYQRSTFCIAIDSQPLYVRSLKNCGFSRVHHTLVEELGISSEVATSLLTDDGPPTADCGEARVVQKLIAKPLTDLVDEITRSIEHFGYQRRRSGPEQIVLMGGGATLAGLPQYLEQQLKLHSRRWQLDEPPAHVAGAGPTSQCMFGAAAALSALACSRTSGKGRT